MDDLLLRASDWSLACDNALLNKLQQISQNMVQQAETVNQECDALMNDVDNLRSKITNVTNDFLVLANTNFVENTVEEFQEFDVELQSSTDQSLLPTKAEKEAVLLEKMKEAIQIGLRTQQENEAKQLRTAESLCNNSVDSRNGLNLGYIIGSPKFFSSKYCGLRTDTFTVTQLSENIPSATSQPELHDSQSVFGTPTSESGNVAPPNIPPAPGQTPTARPSSVASDYLFTSPIEAPGIPSLSSTPNTDASYSPAPLPRSHQHSEATYSTTPFSYIPVPARPPSTPSTSSASSRAGSPLDTDLVHRFTLPSETPTSNSPVKAVPVDTPEMQPELQFPQKDVTASIDANKNKSQDSSHEEVPDSGPKSPSVKAQPVHKFMNASVLSQLQSRLALGPRPPIRSTSSISSEIQAEEEQPKVSLEKEEMPKPKPTAEAENEHESMQKRNHSMEANVASSSTSFPQSMVQVLPTISPIKEQPPEPNQTKTASAQPKSVPKPSIVAAAPIKKSIFDSDSDEDDDFLFSSKPKKMTGAAKASIFSTASASPKKDLFARTAIVDASSDDSEPDVGLFKSAAARVQDRSLFDDIFGRPTPFQPPVPKDVPEQAQSNLKTTITKPNDKDKAIEQPKPKHDIHHEESSASVDLAPENLFEPPLVEEIKVREDIIVVPALLGESPVLESAKTTTVVVQQSQSVTTTTTMNDAIEDTEKDSPDLAAVSEVTTIMEETTTIIEEIITAPEPIGATVHTSAVELPKKSEAPAVEKNGAIRPETDDDDDDLFKEASLASEKPVAKLVPAVKPLQTSQEVKQSHTTLPVVTNTSEKLQPVVKKSIFDSSDSDDDLFSTKTQKSKASVKVPSASLFPATPKNVQGPVIPTEPKPEPGLAKPVLSSQEPAHTPEPQKTEPGVQAAVASTKLHASQVQQAKKPQATSTAVKSKSLFDSTDSDSDDLFSPKSKSKKSTTKSMISTKSSPSPISITSQTKDAPLKSKKTTKLFDDSDDDDDLFTSKSSILGSAKSSLSALAAVSTSTSSTSIPSESPATSSDLLLPKPVTGTLKEQPEAPVPKVSGREINATVKEKFASVSKNLESLFAAKPNIPRTITTGGNGQSPSEEAPPAVKPSVPDNVTKSASFEDQPDSSGLLKCVTKNRPKYSKQRRPPTKGIQRPNNASDPTPDDKEVPKPESLPEPLTKESEVAEEVQKYQVLQVSQIESSFEVQAPPLPPPVPSQTESSDEDDDEDSLFPRNRVYYD